MSKTQNQLKLKVKIHGKVIIQGAVVKNSVTPQFIQYLENLFAGNGSPIQSYALQDPISGKQISMTIVNVEQGVSSSTLQSSGSVTIPPTILTTGQGVNSFTLQLSGSVTLPPNQTITLTLLAVLQNGSTVPVSTVTVKTTNTSTIVPVNIIWMLSVAIIYQIPEYVSVSSITLYNLLYNLFTGKWSKVQSPLIYSTTNVPVTLTKETSVNFDTVSQLITFNPLSAILSGYVTIPVSFTIYYLGTTIMQFTIELLPPPSSNIYNLVSVSVTFA